MEDMNAKMQCSNSTIRIRCEILNKCREDQWWMSEHTENARFGTNVFKRSME
jgi:hypothetical protein